MGLWLTMAVLVAVFLLNSCFPVNHFKLQNRHRRDYKRYEALKSDETSPDNRPALKSAGRYLQEAKRANRRWNNARARMMMNLAEERLESVESPPKIPPSLRKLYENVPIATPEAETPSGE